MPFLSVPTHTAVSTGEWEGGVILTYAAELPAGWSLGIQGEASRVRASDAPSHHWDFLHSIVVGHEIAGGLGGYLEYFGISGSSKYEANLSAGLTFALGPDIQLDFGGVFGLNDAAEDLSLFQGITFRF